MLAHEVAPHVPAGPAMTEGVAEPDLEAPHRELGLVGRLLVGAVLLGGLAVGWLSGFGLYWFIPFAGVAALLVIRRPANSIGWILLGMAWVLVILVVPIDASVETFVTGLPPATFIATALAILAASLIIPLIGLLALVVPSGRLPEGRRGTIARSLLGAAFVIEVLYVIAPTVNLTLPGHPNGVLVRNPLALAPESPLWALFPREVAFPFLLGLLVGSAALLIDRVRRATGIERQQLRWIGASVTLLVGSFLFGVIVPALWPGSEEIAFLPAVLSMSTVPIAIGIAVMRYRLYEIDTVINRAIVYGLLTAILAGGSAAAIGLTQSLFVGVLGPGSTVTIVITTLLVVSAFNPIKTRLQALVDRRFKPAPDPVTSLRAFVAEVRDSVSRPDLDRTFRRLLDVAVPEFATAAEARWTDGAGNEHRAAVGPHPAPYAAPIVVEAAGASVELRLAGSITPRTEAPLREALIAVLEETAAPTA